MTVYECWVDGSSTGRIGKAAGAAIILLENQGYLIAKPLKIECGNNAAELFAIYLAIQELPHNAHATIHTDSKNAIGWLVQGWKRNEKIIDRAVTQILKVWSAKQLDLSFIHVKGHSGLKYNELCDIAANQAKKSGKEVRQEITLAS